MEENKEKYGDAPIRTRSSVFRFLDNFWYHYKWHTLIALFLVFTVTVCLLQTCNRTSYDIHILYMGSREIKRTSQSGGVVEYDTLLTDFSRIVSDLDGDGEVNTDVKTLFFLTEEERAEIEADPALEINESLLQEDADTFSELMVSGDYYLMLLPESLYRQYRVRDGVPLFVPLAAYVGEDEGLSYAGEDAVYLSSTDFGSLPILSELSADTVICLRAVSPVMERLDRSATEKFARSETVLRNLFAYRTR